MIKERKVFFNTALRIVAITAMLCMLWMVSAVHYGTAQVYAGDNIRETDVTSASDGNEIVLVDGSFVYLSKDEILNRINEIRLEACKEGVRDPENPSRNLTEADYVPIKWSSDLEWIAQTRATEATIHKAHQRPNGNQWSDVSHNGVSSNAEDIAWNGSADILYGIDQWYAEKKDWVNNTENAVTGHYTSLISPQYKYIGIGAFKPINGSGAIVGELMIGGSLDESQTGAKGEYKQKVEVQKSKLTVSPDESCTVHTGKTKTVGLNAKTGYTRTSGVLVESNVILQGITYSSADTSVVTVSPDGTINAKRPGMTTINITYSGSTYNTSVTVEDHDYKVETVEPTCTKEGSETSTCSICGDKVTKVIPKTEHKWNEEYTVDTPATCKAEGSESIHCSVCNAIDETTVQTIPVSDHKYGEWTVTKKATCTESGTQEKKCEYCGKTVTESIPATGHQWKSDYTTDKKATHSSTGIESIHCSVCDAIQPDSERTVPIIEHTFGEWEIVKAATCVDDGLKKRTCKDADCGYVEDVTLPATGHKWESDYTEDKAPTCTADGSKSIHCSACDAVKEGSAKKVRATGHKFGNWTITKKPTVDEEGSRERVCSVCGEKETESMDKLSAQAVAAAAIVEADLAAKNAESAAKEAEDLQKAADEAAKTPGDAAIAAAKKAKDAAEAYQKAAKEAKEAADRADAAVDKALEKAQNKIEIAAAEAAKEKSKEIVSSADTTVKKADTAVETATVSLKDAEENKADHTGTPEIKLSATELTYKYHVQKVKVGKKKKKQAVAEEQKPTILTVSLNGKVISADYYDVVWSDENSKNIGKYTVTVTLKNGYKGANVAAYNINPKPAKISKPAKGKKKMTVKWKKAAKNDITYKALDGYEIQYSLSSDFSSADTRTTTASKKAKSKAIKKLQSKQTYYVRIRTYKNAAGSRLYSDWSAVKSVAVK